MTTGARPGPMMAVLAAVVSGFAVFLNGIAVSRFEDATVYTTAKNLVAGAILLIVATVVTTRTDPGRRHRPSSAPAVGLALVALIGGAVPFVLFFEGLARATSTNAAFIHKTLVVWVAIGATVFLRERFSLVHAASVGILLLGFALLAGGGPDSFGAGEAMIFAATLLWATEVVLLKTILPTIPALPSAAARMAGGSLLLVAWLIRQGDLAELFSLTPTQWLWLTATGVTLSMFVATWYHALALNPAIDVTAVLVFGAVITGVLNSGLRGVPVTVNSVGYVLLIVATVIVVFGSRVGDRATVT